MRRGKHSEEEGRERERGWVSIQKERGVRGNEEG